jgi:uncharacterized Zn-finger protein
MTVFVNHVAPAFVWIYCKGVEVRCDVDKATGEAFCPSCGRSFKVSW